MDEPSVVAVVATHRPDVHELVPIIAELQSCGIPVVVADDASPCTSDETLRIALDMGAEVVRHTRNTGIARSLNDGLRLAATSGATWLLTVDQDSCLGADLLDGLVRAATHAVSALGSDRVGAVAPGTVDDASGRLGYPVSSVHGFATTSEVIQTGTLWSVAGLESIGGFDESFGIDAVDAAACVRLRAAGRLIVLAPDVSLAHKLGSARRVSLLGRSVLATGHPPERHTTIVRNRLRLAPEELRQSPVHAFRTLRRVVVNTALAVSVEEDRWEKAKASARGLIPRRDR